MTVPFSEISHDAFNRKVDALLNLQGDTERLATDIGLGESVVRLSQSSQILTMAIKNSASGNVVDTKRQISSVIEDLSSILAQLSVT